MIIDRIYRAVNLENGVFAIKESGKFSE